MFLYQWDTEKCSSEFETMARQLFRRNGPGGGLLRKLHKGIKCLVDDGKYNHDAIDSCLKSTFGETQAMFGFASQPAGIKVAVPAMTISDASCFLFTNYNNVVPRKRACGNKFRRLVLSI
jgi:hypothetical protein